MKVLVYQQFHPGHHYLYLQHLLPHLAKVVDEVVVALTAEGRASSEFATFLQPLEGAVRFEACLPSGHERVIKNQRFRVYLDVRDAVRRIAPDHVLIPSGDPHTTVMGGFRLAGFGAMPGGRPAEVGIHFGRGAGASTTRERLKDYANELKLTLAGWQKVHIVNLLFYEQIQRRGGSLARRSVLLPDPTTPNPRLGKAESRRRLGLPEQGRIIGVAGVIDSRKAVVQLAAAFRAARLADTDRLLLAGRLAERHRSELTREFSDLIAGGRLILIDRFLDVGDYLTALTAMDVVCLPYPGFFGLSGVLLAAVAARRPLVTADAGWCRALVHRFELGRSCDILNHGALTDAVRLALEQAENYVETEAISRLLTFHSPDNFAESWLTEIRRRSGLPASPEFRPWSWVLEALPPERRTFV